MAAKGVSLRLEEKTIEQINKIAELTERDSSYLMRKAIEQFTEHEGWVIEETSRRWEKVRKGTAQLSSHADVAKRFKNRNKS